MKPLPRSDLTDVVSGVGAGWEELRGASLFVTGGTGFFGRWMLESLMEANSVHGLKAGVTVLSRSPERFLADSPHYGRWGAIRWVTGSVDSLNEAQLRGCRASFAVHLATASDTPAPAGDRGLAARVIVGGMQKAVLAAAQLGVSRMLFTSSGSVYERRIPGRPICETDPVLDVPAGDIGGRLKAEAERHCQGALGQFGVSVPIARCFSFAGPGMPVDGRFAFGNFVRDCVRGGPLVVKGDGSSVRSFLYASDLAVWLWQILLKGEHGRPYNVGSETPIAIGDLATTINSELGGSGVKVLGEASAGEGGRWYVPSTERARSQLGVRETVNLRGAIRRTAAWLGS